MPNDLFEIVYARVEVQEVREEERRKHGGRRDRQEPRGLGGSGSPSLGQWGENQMQESSYSGGSRIKEEPVAGHDLARKTFSGHVSIAGK